RRLGLWIKTASTYPARHNLENPLTWHSFPLNMRVITCQQGCHRLNEELQTFFNRTSVPREEESMEEID
ncbi:hypothetical protein NDU88_001578, partial [Pleurodeles waltl]